MDGFQRRIGSEEPKINVPVLFVSSCNPQIFNLYSYATFRSEINTIHTLHFVENSKLTSKIYLSIFSTIKINCSIKNKLLK